MKKHIFRFTYKDGFTVHRIKKANRFQSINLLAFQTMKIKNMN